MLLRRLHQGLALLVSFILLCPPHLLIAANEAAPAWWAEQQMIVPGKVANDYAALNQGQLKNIAAKAAQAMEEHLPRGAGPQVRALVAGWTPALPGTNDYAAMNLGQLKSVAQPFYDRLIQLGLASAYPWTNSPTPPDDYCLALLGQAKFLFSFPLPLLPSGITAPFRIDFARSGLTHWQIVPGSVRPALATAAPGDSPLPQAIAGTTALTLAGEGGLAALPVTLPNRLDADFRLSFAIHWDGLLANPGSSPADLNGKIICDFNGLKLALGELSSPGTAQLYVWEAAQARWSLAYLELDKNRWTRVSFCFNPKTGSYSVGTLDDIPTSNRTFTPDPNPFLSFHTVPGTQLQITDLGLDFIKYLPDPGTIPFAETFDDFWPGEPLRNGFHDWEVELSQGSALIVPDETTGTGRRLALTRPRTDYPLPPVTARRTFFPRSTDAAGIRLEFRVKGISDFGPDSEPIPTTAFLHYRGLQLGWGDSGLAVLSGATWQRVAATPDQFDLRDDEGWRHLRLDINEAQQRFDLYLDDSLAAAQVPFPLTQFTSTAYLDLLAGFPGQLCFDDIAITDLLQISEPEADFTTDSDGDGIPDYWERILGGNPYEPDAHTDPDATGYTQAERYAIMQAGGADPIT